MATVRRRLPSLTWRVISIAALALAFLTVGAVMLLEERSRATKIAIAERAPDPPAAIAPVIAPPQSVQSNP